MRSDSGRVDDGVGEAAPVGLRRCRRSGSGRVEEGVGEEDQRPSTGRQWHGTGGAGG
mgnify:CR=1 FL=1